MNKYGLPLKNGPITQTLLPVMYRSGVIIGYALIASTEFDGTETTYTLPDDVELPITTVTEDVNPTMPAKVVQFVAAVFSDNLPKNFAPWASSYIISPYVNEAPSSFWLMPAQGLVQRTSKGNLVTALMTGMDLSTSAPTTPGAPEVTEPATLYWKASVDYASLFGDCPFFDFNWVALFNATTDTRAMRINVVTVPEPIAPSTNPPLLAKVVGIPVVVGQGVNLYDTIRILRMVDSIPPDDYEFTFEIIDELGQSTPATLTLTVQ